MAEESVQKDEMSPAERRENDPFEGVNLIDSNWKDMASMINTSYFHENNNYWLKKQVNYKLDQIEAMYNLDIQNLNKAKIYDFR